MNKKGAELPMNALIIIILVVIVLIVISVLFLGGTSSLSRSIKSIFFGTTTGTDLNLAVEQCRNHCVNAQSLPAAARTVSGYCRVTYDLDMDGNGKIDAEDKRGIHCKDVPISQECYVPGTSNDICGTQPAATPPADKSNTPEGVTR